MDPHEYVKGGAVRVALCRDALLNQVTGRSRLQGQERDSQREAELKSSAIPGYRCPAEGVFSRFQGATADAQHKRAQPQISRNVKLPPQRLYLDSERVGQNQPDEESG